MLCDDGTVGVTATGLPADQAQAAIERVDRLALAIPRAGHPSPLAHLSADVFLGLLDGSLHHLTRDQILADFLARAQAEDAGDAQSASSRSEPETEERDAGPRSNSVEHPARARRPARRAAGTGADPRLVGRRVVARQRRSLWRFAVVDQGGRFVRGGCRAPAERSDVDHTVDHSRGGLTTQDDLGAACRHDHGLKQAGWTLDQPEPGVFRWTSPLGRTYETTADPLLPESPPQVPHGADADLDEDPPF